MCIPVWRDTVRKRSAWRPMPRLVQSIIRLTPCARSTSTATTLAPPALAAHEGGAAR